MPEEWFCLKVYNFFVGFLIHQISHKSYSSLSPKSLAADFCFKEGLPPFILSLLSKNKLRSPGKTIRFSFVKLVLVQLRDYHYKCSLEHI